MGNLLQRLQFAGVLPAFVWLLCLLVASSDAGQGMLVWMIYFFGGVALAVFWVIRLFLFFIVRGRAPAVELSKHALRLRWSIEPVLLLLGVLFMHSSVLFSLRFQMSRPALERFVQQVQSSSIPASRQARSVGLFHIRETELVQSNIVRLITPRSGMTDHAGLVYSPTSAPPRIGEDVHTHISGPWWHWFRSW
jgi:hypothetical protein